MPFLLKFINHKYKHILALSIFLFAIKANAEDPDSLSFNISGYLKSMGWITYSDEFKNKDLTFLIHNRLNSKIQYGNKFEVRAELRNRFLIGDEVKLNPNYGEQLGLSDQWLRLNTYTPESSNYIFHTNIERLWAQYKTGNWIFKAGRQRINWGIANIWNPNDIFNYYNFLDFDYEERTGADAIKFTYLNNQSSALEGAFALTRNRPVYALKYETNLNKYDLQFLVGSYKNAFTTGMGWAGNIGDVGFKGEVQYFGKSDSLASDLLSTLQIDNIFSNGWYVSASALYNKNGITDRLTIMSNSLLILSPRNLMPARWTLLLSSTKEISPIVSVSASFIYSPGPDFYIFYPTFSYNVSENLNIDLFIQSFFDPKSDLNKNQNTLFIRTRLSF